jgi:hypothetical protein
VGVGGRVERNAVKVSVGSYSFGRVTIPVL